MPEVTTLTAAEAADFGYALLANRQPYEAEKMFRGALRADPGMAKAMDGIGCSLIEGGCEPSDARNFASRAIRICDAVRGVAPDDSVKVLAHHIEKALEWAAGTKSYYEALYWFDQAVKAGADGDLLPRLLSNRGMVLITLGHDELGLADFKRSCDLAGNNGQTWSNLGAALERMFRFEEALEAYDRALVLEPKSAMAHFNRGVVLMRVHRYHEAVACFERALELGYTKWDVRYSLGTSKLVLGDYIPGFAGYEARLDDDKVTDFFIRFREPQLSPRVDIAGKTVCIHGEQGHGDTLMFLRYLPVLIERGAKPLVVCHRGVRPIAELIDGVTVLPPDTPFPPIDYWSPIMSLAWAMETTIDTIPSPFVITSWPDQAKWKAKVNEAAPPGLRVGLVWSGNNENKNDEHRSIAFAELLPMIRAVRAARPEVTFFNLQKDVRFTDEEAVGKAGLINMMPECHDFRDTIHLVRELDVIITPCTSMAHLGGISGTPTWVLIPHFRTHWAWLRDRTDSPWYPSVRLYRQLRDKEWGPLLNEVGSDILRLASA
jgi:hypothetical protein